MLASARWWKRLPARLTAKRDASSSSEMPSRAYTAFAVPMSLSFAASRTISESAAAQSYELDVTFALIGTCLRF